MTYTVKEIFYTLQGEGANAGRPAVFCRFSGCNLWTGREADRANAVCTFCDTDFVGVGPDGGKFATRGGARRRGELALAVGSEATGARPLVVCTGGEPLLQLDEAAMQRAAPRRLRDRGGDERDAGRAGGSRLGMRESEVQRRRSCSRAAMSSSSCTRRRTRRRSDSSRSTFDHFFLQPMDGPLVDENTRLAVAYCLAHPRWRLSVQTHKALGIR